jgi:hypothetical protein
MFHYTHAGCSAKRTSNHNKKITVHNTVEIENSKKPFTAPCDILPNKNSGFDCELMES